MSDEFLAKLKSYYLILFSGILFVGLFYFYSETIQNYTTTPKWLFLVVACFVILLIGKKAKLSWSWALSCWFLFILLYLVQCYWSYNFWDSIVRTVPWILAPLAVLLLRKEEKDLSIFYSKTATVIALLILPILLNTLVDIADLFLAKSFSHLSTYEISSSFGHRNQYAQTIALLVPLFGVGLLFAKSKWQKILFTVTIALIYITAIFLWNRTVILILFGIYPVVLTLLLLQKANPQIRKRGHAIILIGTVAAIVIIASPLKKSIPGVRDLTETSYGSGNERVRIWSNSIDLWQEDVLFGKGSGDWKIEILRTPLEHTKAEDSTVFYQRTHNDFIQIAVENGLLGLLIFIAFFVFGIYHLLKSTIDIRAKILLCGGIAAYIVIANFSFPIERIEILVLLFVFLLPGMSVKEAEVDIVKLYRGKILIGAGLVLIGLFTLSWFQNEQAYFNFKQHGDEAAFAKIDKTKYTIDATTTPLFWIEGDMYSAKEEYKTALKKYKKALEYNPNHVHIINNIGSCHFKLKNVSEAEKYYKRALEVNPRFIETLMNYSSLQFSRGNINGALVQVLAVPVDKEPANYKDYILAIAKAKYEAMFESYDEPVFKEFLSKTFNDDEFLYNISVKCRASGASYERELRNYLEANPSN